LQNEFSLTKLLKIRFLVALLGLATGAGVASAAELSVFVAGPDGMAVPDVAVFVKQQGVSSAADHSPTSAVMDQRDQRFLPHILVVEKGATVAFPNSDVVAHHVYSFSRPNNFVLPLYKGTAPEPVTMTHDGVVTLGCNIHDNMLAYVVVVDTSVFGKTDDAGRVVLNVDENADAYEVILWSPRIRDAQASLTQTVASPLVDEVTFRLQKSLRPSHVEQSDTVAWDDYE
jgi:plastocyanin